MIIDRTTVYRLYENELRLLTGAKPQMRLRKVDAITDTNGKFIRLDVIWDASTAGQQIKKVTHGRTW